MFKHSTNPLFVATKQNSVECVTIGDEWVCNEQGREGGLTLTETDDVYSLSRSLTNHKHSPLTFNGLLI